MSELAPVTLLFITVITILCTLTVINISSLFKPDYVRTAPPAIDWDKVD